MSKRNKALACALLASSLTGCADYLNHRDSVTLGAGNAPEANTAIHTINPFPPEAANTTIIVRN
ncbi:MAG: hypothetical protein LPK02_03790 [Rhodobacterales bacterium]|nr:hypothetical protein [Rhodobacterales bacterium]